MESDLFKTVLLFLLSFSHCLYSDAQDSISSSTEILYNGIQLPKEWPPALKGKPGRMPIEIPYLKSVPEVIRINVGRQLFVDDFLIEETDLSRSYYLAKKFKGNPVLKPETSLELNSGNCPVAAPFSDGVWYDSKDKLFKMWYHAGWFDGIAYATSKDGIHWERPDLGIESHNNRVLAVRNDFRRDGSTVWLDYNAPNSASRFKMFIYFRYPGGGRGEQYTSPDGIHWNSAGITGILGDNSGFFYNPFRNKWVFSIRDSRDTIYGRARYYHESDDFIKAGQWNNKEYSFWQGADYLDKPDSLIKDYFLDSRTQLYKVDAVAYESIMLGLFAIHRGPDNKVSAYGGFPKLTDLSLGYSRDGFYFSRPDRRAFIPSTRLKGDWDRGYIHSAGGCCLIVGDSLYFYYGAWSGYSPKNISDMYAGGSTGLAKLRRDGFASMNASGQGGYLITRKITFIGKNLFVNIENPEGELQVEILDENYKIIRGFSKENCIPVSANKTLQEIRWKNVKDLTSLINKKVRIRFYLVNGKLYSFWISPDKSGASNGYVGAGGPGITGNIDKDGINGYK